MSTTLYRDGLVRSPGDPAATALLIRGGAVAWVGTDADAHVDGADDVVDLGGALVTPAFGTPKTNPLLASSTTHFSSRQSPLSPG
jgi:predicted amidohydrolase YtcJ